MMNANSWNVLVVALLVYSASGELFRHFRACHTPCHSPGYTYINCMGLNLTSIPCNSLKTPKTLDLDNNMLSVLYRKELYDKRYANIERLYLSYNVITVLEDEAFNGLTNLSYVTLMKNNITVFDKNIFHSNSRLHTLILSMNPLVLPSEDSIPLLISSSLQDFQLYACNLTRISRGLFSGTPNLRFLGLNGNKLTIFNWVAYKGLSSLRHLTLVSNLVNRAECAVEMVVTLIETYVVVPEDSSVDLTGNPLECDCCLNLTTFGLRKRFNLVSGSCVVEDGVVRDLGTDDPVNVKQCFDKFTRSTWGDKESESPVDNSLELQQEIWSGSLNESNARLETQPLDRNEVEILLNSTRLSFVALQKEIEGNLTRIDAQLKEIYETKVTMSVAQWVMIGVGSAVGIALVVVFAWFWRERRNRPDKYFRVQLQTLLQSPTHRPPRDRLDYESGKLPKLPRSTRTRRRWYNLPEMPQCCPARRPPWRGRSPEMPQHTALHGGRLPEMPQSRRLREPGVFPALPLTTEPPQQRPLGELPQLPQHFQVHRSQVHQDSESHTYEEFV